MDSWREVEKNRRYNVPGQTAAAAPKPWEPCVPSNPEWAKYYLGLTQAEQQRFDSLTQRKRTDLVQRNQRP